MTISTKQLRMEPGRIISMVKNGHDITITYRGKSSAKLVPIAKNEPKNKEEIDAENELFGLWKDRQGTPAEPDGRRFPSGTENVEQYVRELRKGRKIC